MSTEHVPCIICGAGIELDDSHPVVLRSPGVSPIHSVACFKCARLVDHATHERRRFNSLSQVTTEHDALIWEVHRR
jgi:uncharacterized protein YlaI